MNPNQSSLKIEPVKTKKYVCGSGTQVTNGIDKLGHFYRVKTTFLNEI